MLAAWISGTWAQSPPAVISGVYTCTDAKGRKLTSDRPIPECTDREQKVLNPSGTLKAKIGPSLTALEKAEIDRQEKREQEERNRIADERRRDRALLTRYPTKEVHDGERKDAISQIQQVIHTAQSRMAELAKQRVTIDGEMEFYKKDPSKAPAYVRRQLQENTQSQAAQQKFIAEQEAEIARVNARFDEELTRLRQLWLLTAPARQSQ
ncbi:MAG: DUF4124 domain-containing protein [Burkholderiales bacterium PBB4]|nr:MAG: DUF4124 domain-containing protein [Burkholderiales bacterium PBB4]